MAGGAGTGNTEIHTDGTARDGARPGADPDRQARLVGRHCRDEGALVDGRAADLDRVTVLALVVLIYLALGCLFDGLSLMIMTLPIVFPLLTGLGFDAIWLGVLITIMIEIGQVTPPVGLNLYVIQAVGKARMGEVTAGVWPFILLMLVVTMGGYMHDKIRNTLSFTASLLLLVQVLSMRWNVVIGGQAFSLSFSGYMHYHIPIIPHSLETFKEGLFGALTVIVTPFVLFWIINKFVPSLGRNEQPRG